MWTVEPEVVRVEGTYQGESFWLDLKEELTIGEERKLLASGVRSVARKSGADEEDGTDEVNINLDVVVFMKVKTWITEWSLKSKSGKPLPLTLDTLRSLRTGVFSVIEKIVDEHAAAASKKANSTESKSSTTSG